MVFNLATGPFAVLSLLWVINNEILALPIEMFLVFMFVITAVWIFNFRGKEDPLNLNLGYEDLGTW